MAVKSVSRPLTRKGRATPTTVARPSMICHFGGDKLVITPTHLQQQYLVARGLHPVLAVIAAPLIFGEAD